MRSSAIMAEGEDSVELKFRVYDGTDIAHRSYASSISIATLKERLVAEWPQGIVHFVYISLIRDSYCLDVIKFDPELPLSGAASGFIYCYMEVLDCNQTIPSISIPAVDSTNVVRFERQIYRVKGLFGIA
ncbi:hypothetical protein IFM89_015847 [Coptis chinensis]|uniref:UBL3-like ubiquitin domain-containing protein n=1 Tax=Coptis chinensis TaxID=261450 RepID=A0A835M6G9_9MAGN|nr:hypothetical protein IFM89_015847 [Coptis chinensis]